MLQMRLSVTCSVNGSSMALSGSGKSSMSDSLMAWNPRRLEPSKPMPFSNRSSVSSTAGIEKWCHSPGMSTNLKSTISTLFFFDNSKTSFTAIFFKPPRMLRVNLSALRGAHADKGFSLTRAADGNVGRADRGPGAGDAEADIRFGLRVGVAGEIQVDDAGEHDDVGDHAEHGDDYMLQHAEIAAAGECYERPHAGEAV